MMTAPFIVTEFIAHDSKLPFGSWNHLYADGINALFRSWEEYGLNPDTAFGPGLTHSRHERLGPGLQLSHKP